MLSFLIMEFSMSMDHISHHVVNDRPQCDHSLNFSLGRKEKGTWEYVDH